MAVPTPESQPPRPVARVPEPPSLELLHRAQSGDVAALDRLCALYLGPLRRWASGRLPARARGMLDTDDLVQETLVRALTHVEGFEPRRPGALQAYLRQAVMNRVRDQIRNAARRPPPEAVDSGVVDEGPSPLDATIGAEALARYERALEKLGDEERAAVIVRVELRMTYAEIATEFEKPSPDAARMMVSRALIRLAEEMADDAQG